MTHTRRVRLTKAGISYCRWALDAMDDYARHEADCDYPHDELPIIKGRVLLFSPGGAIEDLLFRVGEQLPDMAPDSMSPATAARIAEACRSTCRQISKAIRPDEVRCPECGSTAHVASQCDMEG